MNLYDLDPGPDCPEIVRMIVEIPRNSSNKYEYDGDALEEKRTEMRGWRGPDDAKELIRKARGGYREKRG